MEAGGREGDVVATWQAQLQQDGWTSRETPEDLVAAPLVTGNSVGGGQTTAEDGGDVDQGQLVQLAPTDAELERAIASVPGVVSAEIDRSRASGRSCMRLRLAPGEDEKVVTWGVTATLRERFGIAIDPEAIRSTSVSAPDPADDPLQLMSAPDTHVAGDAADAGHTAAGGAVPEADDPRPRFAEDLADTRERLRLAAAGVIKGVARLTDAAEVIDVAGIVDQADLAGRADMAAMVDVADVVDAVNVVDVVDVVDVAGLTDLYPRARDVPADTAPTHGVGPEMSAPGGEGHALPDGRPVIPRAAISDLQIHRDARSVQVNVVLRHGKRSEHGRALSVPTSHGTLRAVAEATVAALRLLTEGSLLVGIDRVSVRHEDDAPIATVLLSLLTQRGEERLLGASIVRDGPERAVLRATLDALNRRVTPLL